MFIVLKDKRFYFYLFVKVGNFLFKKGEILFAFSLLSIYNTFFLFTLTSIVLCQTNITNRLLSLFLLYYIKLESKCLYIKFITKFVLDNVSIFCFKIWYQFQSTAGTRILDLFQNFPLALKFGVNDVPLFPAGKGPKWRK